MKVLLVCVQYPPEVGSGAKLVFDLARWMCARGHDVSVLTCVPKAKLAVGEETVRLLEGLVDESGVSVIRADIMPMTGVNYVKRGLATIVAPFQMLRVLNRYRRESWDAVFVYSPPLTFGYIGLMLQRQGARFVFNIQDIFPQNAIDLGILRSKLLIGFFKLIERFIYRSADVLTVHSPGNARYIVSAGGAECAPVAVLDNWIDSSSSSPPGRRDFRAEYGLGGKVVALFAGVIGPSQGLSNVVRALAQLRDLEHFLFLVVGDGSDKLAVENLVSTLGLRNVVFRPFISQDDYPDLLASVDIGIVSLSPNVKTPVVPGKLLGYMAAGLPVAAFVNQDSDVFPLVRKAQCGEACASESIDEVALALRRLATDEEYRRVAGGLGKAYSDTHFSLDSVGANIERLLSEQQTN
jgi:colanic acid biosynthesis glycosyl transferase WcaI